MTDHLQDQARVQDAVARGDRRRRARSALARVRLVAPWAGGASLLVALLGRSAGLPPMVSVAVVVTLGLGVGAAFLWMRRSRGAADQLAARLDADAELNGELRSAYWFVSQSERDGWTDYHVARAADRVQAVDWVRLYPAVRAGRGWAVTAAGVLGALTLAVTAPVPDRAVEAAALTEAEQLAAEVAGLLPPELQAELEALLQQMGQGGAAGDLAEATLAELQDLLKRVDPELSAKLAEMAKAALEAEASGAKPAEADGEMAKNTSAGLPEDVRWAVDDLAERLANASRDRQTAEDNPSASEESGEMGAGSEQAASAEAGAGEAEMKMTREAAADPGAAKMMMGGAGAMGGDSRPGSGGNNGAAGTAPDPLSIAQALRQELVEASVDTKGQNVEKEDIRRKTEQGEASVGFTQAVPPSTVDRSRAEAPPIVPDSYRALLFNYFIRQK